MMRKWRLYCAAMRHSAVLSLAEVNLCHMTLLKHEVSPSRSSAPHFQTLFETSYTQVYTFDDIYGQGIMSLLNQTTMLYRACDLRTRDDLIPVECSSLRDSNREGREPSYLSLLNYDLFGWETWGAPDLHDKLPYRTGVALFDEIPWATSHHRFLSFVLYRRSYWSRHGLTFLLAIRRSRWSPIYPPRYEVQWGTSMRYHDVSTRISTPFYQSIS